MNESKKEVAVIPMENHKKDMNVQYRKYHCKDRQYEAALVKNKILRVALGKVANSGLEVNSAFGYLAAEAQAALDKSSE